jgi:uncharacterized membrane protein
MLLGGFYVIVFILGWFGLYDWLFWLEVIALLFGFYLVYLMVRIRLVCVVCIGIHVVNLLLLGLVI